MNSFFYNNDGAVSIETSNPNDFLCIQANIVFVNVTVYNTTRRAKLHITVYKLKLRILLFLLCLRRLILRRTIS